MHRKLLPLMGGRPESGIRFVLVSLGTVVKGAKMSIA